MNKKIIDIFPPAGFQKVDFPEKIPAPDKKNRRGNKIKLAGGAFLFLVLAVLYLHFFLARAEIKIKPESASFDFNEQVIINSQKDRLDFASKTIPGRIVETEKTVSGEFPASGSALKKAEGVIRLYNSYTTQVETWRQGTRFVSSEGKLFLSKDKIQVPGAAIKNGKITSSFVEVPVVAAEGGEEYNIGPSNFSIASFLGTLRYTKYYGESSQSMAGGGTVGVATKDDFEEAESVLTEKSRKELEEDLAKKIPEGFAFLARAGEMKILQKNFSADVGAQVDKFKLELLTKLTVISFDSRDMEDLARHFILSKISPEQKLNGPSLKIQYANEALNLPEGRLTLSLGVSGRSYYDFDLDSLKRALAGKSLPEAKILLANQQGVLEYSIRLFPFWLTNLPDNLEKVKVNLAIID